MQVESIIIFDYNKKKIRKFEFTSGVNLFVSKSNTIGKSSLIKSIYHNLGYSIKIFPNGWQYEDMIFKICIKGNDFKHSITRHKNLFYIDESTKPLTEKEFSLWMQELLDIEILLKEKNSSELKQVYSSEVLLPFYIDQDKSWNGYVFSKTSDSYGRYTNVVPTVLDVYFEISNKKLLEYQLQNNKHKKKLKSIENKIEALALLDEKHRFSVSKTINYLEDNKINRETINHYIDFINSLNQTINEEDIRLLEVQKVVNQLLGDLKELDNLYNIYSKRLTEIEYTCVYCNSRLTEEQSLMRLKIRNNLYEIIEQKNVKNLEMRKLEEKKKLYEEEKEKNIFKFKRMINDIEGVEEFKDLSEYIDSKVDQKLLYNYLRVEKELQVEKSNEIASIEELNNKIKSEKKKTQKKKSSIKKRFEELINKYQLELSEVNLDDIKLYNFKEIKGSGNDANKKMLATYVLYSNLINEYSEIKLPFAMDSFIKNETAKDFKEEMFRFLSKNYLSINHQVFFSIIEENLIYLEDITGYNLVNLEKPILSEEAYETNPLVQQFRFITKV